jgi:AcrR family transcriptional regulator
MMLLEAAEKIMLEEGYAAVSSRRVASQAGLKPQLVHYYFRTMDDLFLALLRLRFEQVHARYAEALVSDNPLRAIWEVCRNGEATPLLVEFMGLANHRKVIASEIAVYSGKAREIQVAAIDRYLKQRKLEAAVSPGAAASILTAIAMYIRDQLSIGLTEGHDDIEALVEHWIEWIEKQPKVQARAEPVGAHS